MESLFIFLPFLFLYALSHKFAFQTNAFQASANILFNIANLTLTPLLSLEIYSASIVISTHDRIKCLQRVVDLIYNNMPQDTELVIADDHSKDTDYEEYYKQLQGRKNVAIYRNEQTKGAFQTKLLGFRNARGEYVMSCDDDDLPDPQYYIEMKANIDRKYDIIATKRGVYFKYNESKISLNYLITSFHNHVNMAIRKSLIMSIPYPENVTIVRDDAPIVIPLYIGSAIDKIKFYDNKNRYNLDRKCKYWHSGSNQMSQYYRQKEVRNGYYFLMNYTTYINKTEYHRPIRQAYNGYIRGAY